MAGISLAALNIPQAIGCTKIAGSGASLACLAAAVASRCTFAAYVSSRYLVVAADSATAAVLARLAVKAVARSEQYVALAGLVALLTALFLLLARFFRLGSWQIFFPDAPGWLSRRSRIPGRHRRARRNASSCRCAARSLCGTLSLRATCANCTCRHLASPQRLSPSSCYSIVSHPGFPDR